MKFDEKRMHQAMHRIELDLVEFCDLRCNQCSRVVHEAPSPRKMTVQQVERFVQESLDLKYAWERIHIIGGEPTLHPEFLQICDVLMRYKREYPSCVLELRTNGRDGYERVKDKIPEGIAISNSTAAGTKVGNDDYTHHDHHVAPSDYAVDLTDLSCQHVVDCGMNLGVYGYLPCHACSALVRMFNINDAVHSLRDITPEWWLYSLEKFCSKCGFILVWNKRTDLVNTGRWELDKAKSKISPAWEKAIKEYDIHVTDHLVETNMPEKKPGPISFTFAGRKHLMKLMVPYLLRERTVSGLQKHIWCLYTRNAQDIEYAKKTAIAYPGFFEVLDTGVRPSPGDTGWHSLYKYFNDPDQTYVKIDDDICWMAPGCIGILSRFSQENPEYFLSLANIVNNGVLCHLHQKFGALCAPEIFAWDPGSCHNKNKESTLRIHESFFEKHAQGKLDMYKFPKWILWERNFPIFPNMFAVQGKNLRTVREELISCQEGDRVFLSGRALHLLDKANCIVGDALVVHYSNRIQASVIDYTPSVYDRYEKLSKEEIANVQ